MSRKITSSMAQDGVVIFSCGGTIEKTYSENDGSLLNRKSRISREILHSLRLPYTQVTVRSVMAVDSLEMNDSHRKKLLNRLEQQQKDPRPILVVHGTDTMTTSMDYVQKHLPDPRTPIVFTGAMSPLELRNSDAKQNIIEAMMAAQLLSPGVYLSFHGKIFTPGKVRKNFQLLTFEVTEG